MRLLFDANLSPVLVHQIADLYPHSAHALNVGLPPPPADEAIWAHAKSNDFVIVTKDADFDRLSSIHGAPPKVIWLRIGNAPTAAVEALLRRAHSLLLAFERDPQEAIAVLRPTRV
jgi:predicted nuclease of predicted toxin-antitoxin system